MLAAKDIVVRCGDFQLKEISITVERGRCLAIVGPTGAGKTLLLETMLGLRPLHAGTVLLEGRDIRKIPVEDRGFSYLPQDLALFPHLNVRDTIAFGLAIRGIPAPEIDRRVRKAAGMLKIENLLDRKNVENLSGGEKQRVALARALAIDSHVLFLDEPFCALDASVRYALIEEFSALREELGLTVVFITHDMHEAILMADRMAVIIDGELKQAGPPEKVYERPRTAAVAELLCVENILPVDEIVSGGECGITSRAGGLVVSSTSRYAEGAGGKQCLGIRARYVTVATESAARNTVGENWYPGIIERISGPPSARRILIGTRDGGRPPVECDEVESGERRVVKQEVFFHLPKGRVFIAAEDRDRNNAAASSPPKGRRRLLAAAAAAAVAVTAWILLSALISGPRRRNIRVSAAVILDRAFARMEREFEKEHPSINVRLDIEPSVTIARTAALRKCDVLAVVDHTLIKNMLSRREAPWAAKFAATEMVLVYRRDSTAAAEITGDNWYRILLRDDVQYGYSNPRLNPCGYFTLLCWSLAGDYYGRPGLRDELVNHCPDTLKVYDPPTLLAALQAGAFDYTFVPKPHADDLGLPYLRLPPEVNCGEPALAAHYAKFTIDAPDYQGGHRTVTASYADLGIAVLENGRDRTAAGQFVEFVLSEKGMEILGASNLRPLDPPVFPGWCQKVPSFLRK